jgi:hypothetical protein
MRKRKIVGGIDGLKDRLKSLRKMEVAIGFPKGTGQAYPDGTPVVEVAAAHVFGVGVPERDFMALAKPKVMAQWAEIGKSIASLSKIKDAAAIVALLKAAGEMGINEIRAAIVDGSWQPNSSYPMSKELREKVSASWGIDIPPGMSYLTAKVKYRGSDHPLIDTGHMVQAVTAVTRERAQ